MQTVSPLPLKATQSITPTRPAKTQSPQFGCRLLAVMSPAPYEGQDTFIKELLIDGRDSLLRQSQLPFREATPSPPPSKADPEFDKADFIANGFPIQISWGLAIPDQLSRTLKSARPASLDPAFIQLSPIVAHNKPITLVGHLRHTLKIEPPDMTPENAHPFPVHNGFLAQVGAIPVDVLETMGNRLKEAARKDPQVALPQGTTDTEVVACQMALKLKERFEQNPTQPLSAEQIKAVFQDLVSETILAPEKLSDQAFSETRFNGFQGAVRNASNTFIFANAQQMLFSQQSMGPSDTYYLGTHQTAGGQTNYVISPRPMFPSLGQQESLNWTPLPNNAMTELKRVQTEKNGPPQIQIEQIPLPTRPNKKQEEREDLSRIKKYVRQHAKGNAPHQTAKP
ncbi:class II glutamine amidotransferase [Vampirovibrio sp.]|uniref:class II glutamine amidotransferase n=1 Tax=Vampirovibrio sp. TaxID=2717857 RepID=UPI003594921F